VEPERNIEKELKAYAEQRRAQAGAPPELHPATRKLLQDEAARSAKSEGTVTRSRRRTLSDLWPRFALAGFAIAVLTVTGWWFLSSSKDRGGALRSRMEVASYEVDKLAEKPAAKRRALNDPAAPENRGQILISRDSQAENKLLQGILSDMAGDQQKTASSPPAPVASPAPATSPLAVALIARPKTSTGIGSFSSFGSGVSLGPSHTAGTISSPTGAKDRSLFGTDLPAAPASQQFLRTYSPQFADGSTAVSAVSNVLASFRVEQTSGKLQMIDSDGSVYDGFVEQTSEARKTDDTGVKKILLEEGIGGGAQSQPLHLFRFRVSGTNRTLHEALVFSGNFLTSGETPLAQQLVVTNGSVGGLVAPPTAGGRLGLELQKASVQGRLSLGESNSFEINALPAKP
jgi:hypothetical protein